jgi:hypothetical protein
MPNLKYKYHVILLISIVLVTGALMGMTLLKKSPDKPKGTYVAEVVVTPTAYIKIPPPEVATADWKTFFNKNLKLTMKYPPEVMLDPRQTSQGRLYAFIFTEDKTASLPGNVTALYVADTQKSFIDGFSAFRKSDCSKECAVSYKKTQWVNINNVYGVKNPLPEDVHNYYLTDQKMSGSVVNAYVGGYLGEEQLVKEKIKTFEDMIKTIRFER